MTCADHKSVLLSLTLNAVTAIGTCMTVGVTGVVLTVDVGLGLLHSRRVMHTDFFFLNAFCMKSG